jgi:transcriptional regulator with XRE-family HTH domain
VAQKCNAAHSYIRQIECGNRSPSFAFIGKLAQALQIEPYQLFYDETAKPGQTAHERRLKAIQTRLQKTVSSNIQAAFDEITEP